LWCSEIGSAVIAPCSALWVRVRCASAVPARDCCYVFCGDRYSSCVSARTTESFPYSARCHFHHGHAFLTHAPAASYGTAGASAGPKHTASPACPAKVEGLRTVSQGEVTANSLTRPSRPPSRRYPETSEGGGGREGGRGGAQRQGEGVPLLMPFVPLAHKRTDCRAAQHSTHSMSP